LPLPDGRVNFEAVVSGHSYSGIATAEVILLLKALPLASLHGCQEARRPILHRGEASEGVDWKQPMRWLMIGLFVSVVALLAASAALVHHVWQERRKHGHTGPSFGRADDVDIETEEAP